MFDAHLHLGGPGWFLHSRLAIETLFLAKWKRKLIADQSDQLKSESLSSHFHCFTTRLSLWFLSSRLKTWHTLLLGLCPFLDDGLSGCQLVALLHLDRRVFCILHFRKAERQGTARLHPLSCWMSKHEPCSTQTLEWNDATALNLEFHKIPLTKRSVLTSSYIVHSQALNFPLRCNCFWHLLVG